jgi:transcriptional regulator with XRE-family HTH domain
VRSCFTPEQSEILRNAARDLLARFGSQVRLAKELGLWQPSLSNLLSGKFGASHALARKIAALKGRSLEDLLGIEEGGVEPADDCYPNRALAIELARHDGLDEDAIRTIALATLQQERDLRVVEWLVAICDEARRRKRFGAFLLPSQEPEHADRVTPAKGTADGRSRDRSPK